MRNINIILLALLLIASCNNSEKNTDFDKGPILENIAYNLAIPAYENSLKSFVTLDSAISFLEDYNNGYNLSVARDLWIIATTNWAKTAPYNFGPIDELLIENNFHYFPTDTSKLKTIINEFDGDTTFINNLGSHTRGLSALEFLLFNNAGEIKSNELAFLKMLSNDLVKLNLEILNHWKSDYAEAFGSKTGSDVSSSITLLTNQWIEVAEKIKNDKIGMPSGKSVGAEKNIYALQAPFSGSSSEIIKANLMALQQSFNGIEGKSVDDYLNALDIVDQDDIPLSKKINSQFDLMSELFSGEGNDLKDLIDKDAEKLNQIYLELLNLTILLKTDMMGQLGLITTFSDSDGD